MTEIGRFLKAKRELAKCTQSTLAVKSGLKYDSAISNIENGSRKVSWDELCRFSQVLGNFHPFEALKVAGYITEDDINPAHTLYHYNELDERERRNVQEFIDFLIYKRANIHNKGVGTNGIQAG